ncbi:MULTISPECIES: tetratricopeptide repeat protein [Asticcacaulis]|uniref:tetratricopeptide repeat protein n=1 Tax=Asticcacaulis TaxID=76890 RepID=UPI001AE296CF|nr:MULTISPECIES: tetratricopeptide repeat protein [Asticcacaulis]MBP2157475.1 tetratricopeptide (TPR) repeat protein [Asticcacaulis solisilvae]MDR6798520.1 tetratricopeptide (TPR) repeat protein [Asticcacaulis sp. BE141]
MDHKFEALVAEGRTLRFSNPNGAATAFSSALVLADAEGDPSLQVRASIGLGQILRDSGNTVAATELYARAVILLRNLKDEQALASALRHLGEIWLDAGEAAKARPFLEEALHIYRRHRETPPLVLANALRPIALLEETTGANSIPTWTEARELYRLAGVQDGIDECDKHLAA